MKKKRPWLLTIIAILTILGGLLGIIQSFPFYNIDTALYRGGIPNENTVTISMVQPNSPAFSSGLKVNDKIISVNGQTIHTTDQFISLTHQNLGKSISLVVLRNNKQVTITPTLRSAYLPTEGPLGIVIVGSGVMKEPALQLVISTILRSYAGYEERLAPSIGGPISNYIALRSHASEPYYDKSLARLRELILGIVSVGIGIGLLRLKKWA